MAGSRRGLSMDSSGGVRPVLSVREATLLADVSETKVRKDIETRLLTPIRPRGLDRLFFRWVDVFLLAAVYKSSLLTSTLRKRTLEKLETLVEPACRHEFYRFRDVEKLISAKRPWLRSSNLFAHCDQVKLDKYVFIDVKSLIEELSPRVDLYANGLSHIEEREGVVGGEAVFRGTRLSVRHIGKMYDTGEPASRIIEDYPYLRDNDIKFAHLFYKAHPTVGRPLAREVLGHAGNTST